MWSVIIILILVGLALLVLEILVVPGTGVAGIIGFAVMAAGIWMAYTRQGVQAGHITLVVTLGVNLVGLVLALRSKTWKKAMLKTEIDLEVFLYLTPAKPKGTFIWGIGPNVVFPTATNSNLGTSKWSVGPALALGVQSGGWTAFGLFDNVWSVGGWGDTPVNTFNFQYYITWQSPGSWFLITNYVISSDWLAPVGEKWTVPLGAGAGSMVKFHKLSGAAYIQSSYNVVAPTGGSNWGVVFAFELIF